MGRFRKVMRPAVFARLPPGKVTKFANVTWLTWWMKHGKFFGCYFATQEGDSYIHLPQDHNSLETSNQGKNSSRNFLHWSISSSMFPSLLPSMQQKNAFPLKLFCWKTALRRVSSLERMMERVHMDMVKCCGGNLVRCRSKREFESQTFAHIQVRGHCRNLCMGHFGGHAKEQTGAHSQKH